MRRCPQCRRDYYDETLIYCLDDGSALLDGPASGDETTAILHETDSPGEAPTRALSPFGANATSDLNSTRTPIIVAAICIAVIAAAGAGGYFYYLNGGSRQIKSVAVVPFVTRENDPQIEYLADGISENINNSLSRVPNLKVMSRNSVVRYKGKGIDAKTVANELNVQAVITGTVVQHGEVISINVELINGADNSQIWGQHFSRNLTNVLTVQEEIAKAISEKLSLTLTASQQKQLAKPPTENIKASQYYLQGYEFDQRRTKEDLLTAVSYYEKAIQEDGDYALAYAGLADAYANLGLRGYIAPSEGRRKTEELARKALSLDENLAESHVALGQSYVQFNPYNFPLGDVELRTALELSPSSATARKYLGFSLLKQGRLDEALEEALKARDLDPLSSIIAKEVAFCYHLKRDHRRAIDLLRQADELGPAMSTQWEVGMYIQNGLYVEALEKLQNANRERKDDPILIYSTGLVYAAQGKRAEALQIIKELEEKSGPHFDQAHWISKIYSALGEKDLALRWLERGLSVGAIGGFYKDEPVWDPIRSDPRFADLLLRMGLPQ